MTVNKQVYGLDLQKAYRQVDGNHEFLLRFLSSASTQFDEELRALKQSLGSSLSINSRPELLPDLLHRFIGLTGNIAATSSHQLLIKSEDAYKRGDLSAALLLLDRTSKELKLTARSIQEYTPA